MNIQHKEGNYNLVGCYLKLNFAPTDYYKLWDGNIFLVSNDKPDYTDPQMGRRITGRVIFGFATDFTKYNDHIIYVKPSEYEVIGLPELFNAILNEEITLTFTKLFVYN